MTNPATEFDSPWKEIVQNYFPEFIEFFFPQVYQEIDWNQGFEFLDQELQQVVRDAELGKRLVDKLSSKAELITNRHCEWSKAE